MNAKRLLVASGLVAVAVSANAQISLKNAGSFSLGGIFNGLGATPQYSNGSPTSSITLNNHKKGAGSLNQWWFSVTDTGADITSVSYSITLTGINATTKVSGLIMGYNYVSGTAGKTVYTNTQDFGFNVEAATGSHAYTQTLDFTEYLSTGTNTDFNTYAASDINSKTAFYKANFQFTNVVPEPTGVAALSIGALGLLIRRRRSK
jgi:hypothetical protein